MLVGHQLPSVTVTAGGTATVQLKDLPKQVRGRIAHVQKFEFECNYTPTTTALPTTVGNNNLFTKVDFWDGRINRFVGGFNHLRARERIEAGRIRNADADTDTASGTARYFRRVLHLGPQMLDNVDSDFKHPCGDLDNGELRINMGNLTDFASDCTAVSGTVRVIAWLELADEICINPAFQFQYYAASAADVPLPGEALWVYCGMLNSSSFDAITAGDFGNIRFDLGKGDVVPSLPAPALAAAYNDDFFSGALETIQGEPRAASDDNLKSINRASPTAIAATTADLQMVYWAKRFDKLSKLESADSSARLQWDGSQSTAVILIGRIVPQESTVIGARAAVACRAVNRQLKGLRIKTESKQPYNGPLVKYMPYKASV